MKKISFMFVLLLAAGFGCDGTDESSSAVLDSGLDAVAEASYGGSTTTSDRNNPMKMTPAMSPGIVFIGLNSVTSLNGQNHSQYTADMAPSEASTMNAKKPN